MRGSTPGEAANALGASAMASNSNGAGRCERFNMEGLRRKESARYIQKFAHAKCRTACTSVARCRCAL
ncbi:hypothetical protein GCM10008098_25720 [Rhodanobacter panaciterrae]|uniref:Uncharacterized protein n=1 Tax=Rhodanobacter panaciterrae TaxID=490572 RepID=A0ABQ3A1B2_9GAMM|nr:hypothetical protein GCM10008098_25720 [Rhodanobacter panaciterrae]